MKSIVLLFAEDDTLLRTLLPAALADAGFECVTAADGSKAIEELDADINQFSGVITDIRLGAGPSGWDVGHHARQLAPEMSIVYISGDSASEWAANGVPNSIMLSKPFADAQLITAISQLINAVPPPVPAKPSEW